MVQCVTFSGQTLMTGAVGVYLPVVLDTHSGRTFLKHLIITMASHSLLGLTNLSWKARHSSQCDMDIQFLTHSLL